MRVAIDARNITGKGAGVSHYTSFLIRALVERNDAEYGLLGNPETLKEFSGMPSVTVISVKHIPFFASHWQIARVAEHWGADVFHSPAGNLPLNLRIPGVLTIHDLAIAHHPEWFSQSRIARWFSLKFLLKQSVRRAKKIIVPSEAVKKDVIAYYGVPNDRVVVTPLGVNVTFADNRAIAATRERYGLRSKYFLSVGTIEPRKNFEQLVSVFGELHRTEPLFADFELMIAGGLGWKYDAVFQMMKKVNHETGKEIVRYLGYVSAEEKMALLADAFAFVFPSWYEGFGLPVLEAMAVGIPVITTSGGALREMVEEAALVVSPDDSVELRDAFIRMVKDTSLRKQLVGAGHARASQFSWEETAQKTFKAYQTIVRV